MSDMIYIICERKTTADGLTDYIPVLEYGNSTWDIVAYENLITLQDEREDFIMEKSVCGVCIRVIPIEFPQYVHIRQELSSVVKKAEEKISNAADSMKEAFESINRKFDVAQYKEQQLANLDVTSVVKCIDQRMCIGDQRGDYIVEKQLPFTEIPEKQEDGFDSYLTSMNGEF